MVLVGSVDVLDEESADDAVALVLDVEVVLVLAWRSASSFWTASLRLPPLLLLELTAPVLLTPPVDDEASEGGGPGGGPGGGWVDVLEVASVSVVVLAELSVALLYKS